MAWVDRVGLLGAEVSFCEWVCEKEGDRMRWECLGDDWWLVGWEVESIAPR